MIEHADTIPRLQYEIDRLQQELKAERELSAYNGKTCIELHAELMTLKRENKRISLDIPQPVVTLKEDK